MRKRIERPKVEVRQLPADDPQSMDHPSHEEQRLELARALGRAMADRDFDRLHGIGGGNEDRRDIRKVFKRPAKGSLD
jgi:hypothetical protein